MVVVPAAIPPTTPEAVFTLAISGSALTQLPPVGVSPSTVVCPAHTVVTPKMADGVGLAEIESVAVAVPQTVVIA